MSEELKPCPFCGAPAMADNGFAPAESIIYAFCSNNDCRLHSVDVGLSPEEWNQRALPDAFQIARHSKRLVEQQRERIAALEAKNAALAGANDNLKITINGLVDELDALAAELAAIKGQELRADPVKAQLLEALEASNTLLRIKRHACGNTEVCRVLDTHITRNSAAIAAARKEGGE